VTTTRACKGERQGRVCRKNTGHRHTGQDENESGERGRKNYIKNFFKKIIEKMKSANTYAKLVSSQYRGSRAPCVCLRTKAATSTRQRRRRARTERERERARKRGDEHSHCRERCPTEFRHFSATRVPKINSIFSFTNSTLVFTVISFGYLYFFAI
jgi:hypothetical protein